MLAVQLEKRVVDVDVRLVPNLATDMNLETANVDKYDGNDSS